MRVDVETARAVGEQLEAAAAEIFERHGLSPRFKRRVVYGETLKVSLETSPLDLDENGVNRASPEASAWRRNCAWADLDPDAVGRTFEWNRREFTLVGRNPRARKYPIVAEDRATGTRYKLPEASVAVFRKARVS